MPPERVRLFRLGKNHSSKGIFVLTKKQAEKIALSQKIKGNLLPFDFNHKMIDSDAAPEQRVAAGWFELEANETGLWATNISWTERAKALLESREYRYISPTFTTLGNEVCELINVALTNQPALFNLVSLSQTKDFSMDLIDEINQAKMIEGLPQAVLDLLDKCKIALTPSVEVELEEPEPAKPEAPTSIEKQFEELKALCIKALSRQPIPVVEQKTHKLSSERDNVRKIIQGVK